MADADMVRQAYAYFLHLGYRPAQAAAIAGNMQMESGGNTTIRGDGGKAYGSMQWHPDRQVKLAEYAARHGTTMDDPETQWGFIDWELMNNEVNAGGQLRRARDVQSANDAVLAYLRPAGWDSDDATRSAAYQARLRYSRKLLGLEDDPEAYSGRGGFDTPREGSNWTPPAVGMPMELPSARMGASSGLQKAQDAQGGKAIPTFQGPGDVFMPPAGARIKRPDPPAPPKRPQTQSMMELLGPGLLGGIYG